MQHKLVSGQLEVLINTVGAEICSVKNTDNTEFIWQADKTIWGRHSPVLFPIVGKLKDNSFRFEGKEYQLSQHGFARDQTFTLTGKSASACTFALSATPQSKQNYPFDFEFSVNYTLVGNCITCAYKITNAGDKRLYFSVGAHPGFNCPLAASEKFTDYYLEFEANTFELTTLSGGLRLAKKQIELKDHHLNLSEALFDNDALVFENNQINKISLRSSVSSHAIEMDCSNWPYFGIWASRGHSKFVCLEPWHGIADHENTNREFTEKPGIIELKPNEVCNFHFSISFI